MDQDATWYGGRPLLRPHTVLDGTQLSSLPQRGTAPIFGPYLLLPNGWMDQNATSYRKVGLDTGNIVLDGDPATPASATDS